MSPSVVVMVSCPSATWYLVGSSRTIAFHRHSSRPAPLKSSLGSVAPLVPSGSKRIQSNVAVGLVVAPPDTAAGPIFGAAKVLIGAGRPTGENVSPSVEYDARRSVPSDVSHT